MIERRQFLVGAGAGIAALSPLARPAAGVHPLSAPAPRLLASNALALLRG